MAGMTVSDLGGGVRINGVSLPPAAILATLHELDVFEQCGGNSMTTAVAFDQPFCINFPACDANLFVGSQAGLALSPPIWNQV